MTTVESIIKDFLDRGYSLEDLRRLAMSKSGEQGEKLLAVLDALSKSQETAPDFCAADDDSGPYETAAYPVVMTEEDMVFFIAGDEEDMTAAEAAGADVMAAASESGESVADIIIGETDGSGLIRQESSVSASEPAHAAEPDKEPSAVASSSISIEAAKEESGILNKIWSKVSSKSSSTNRSFKRIEKLSRSSPSGSSSKKDASDSSDSTCIENQAALASGEESSIADVSGSALFFETVAEESSIAIAEASEVVAENTEPVLTAEAEINHDVVDEKEIATASESSDFCANAEIRADYLPGSVMDFYNEEKDEAEKEDEAMHMDRIPVTVEEARQALLDAQRMVAESEQTDPDSPSEISSDVMSSTISEVAESAAHAEDVISPQDLLPDTTQCSDTKKMIPEDAIIADGNGSKSVVELCGTESGEHDQGVCIDNEIRAEEKGAKKRKNKARRKRERALRKQAEKNTGSKIGELPEIVLTRSEGTETLIEEDVTETTSAADESPMSADAVSELNINAENEQSNALLAVAASDVTSEENAAEEMITPLCDDTVNKSDSFRERQAMSLLTPMDLLGEDSNAEELYGFASSDEEAESSDGVVADSLDCPEVENTTVAGLRDDMIESAPVASDNDLTSCTQPVEAVTEALTPEQEANDHVMIISGGGIQPEEYAGLVQDEHVGVLSEQGQGLEFVSEIHDEIEDEADNNVILFSEKFPVFSGIRADACDESDEDFSVCQLRMLSHGASDETENTLPEKKTPGDESPAVAGHCTGLKLLAMSEEADAMTDAPEEPIEHGVTSEPALTVQPVENTVPEHCTESELSEPVAELEETCSMTAPVCMDDFPADSEEIGVSASEVTTRSEPDVVERAQAGVSLDDKSRGALVRALYGRVDDSWLEEEGSDISALHAIVPEEPERETTETLVSEAAVRAEMEAEYQERLNEFASRIFQVQAAHAADAEKLAQKQNELDARTAIIEEMQKRLDAEEMRIGEISGKLAEANSELDKKNNEIKVRNKEREVLSEIRGEHGRLYKEFEDLRRGYNEIVTDVLPKLQSERDDLVLTVERQCEDEEKMRGSLSSVRKRLAVGYSLAGAACLALCALPVAFWVKSGRADQEMAIEHQKMAELHETLQREVQGNIVARNTIVELENKVNTARAQLTDMHRKNQELARLSRTRSTQPGSSMNSQQHQDVAVFKPAPPSSGGTPTRASDMALQATDMPGGRLHVNQVRDPSGSIEELAYQNRQALQQNAGQQMAYGQGNGGATRPVTLSAVNQSAIQSESGNLRPVRQVSAIPGSPPQPLAMPMPLGGSGTDSGGITARVKKGEGVAQVVYRVLGTWDSEIIAWVVKENDLALDKKGNPRIHPDQELRLPGDARSIRSASAGRKM